MSTIDDARAEEREAKARARHMEQMSKARKAAAQRATAEAIRRAVDETHAQYPRCKCDLRAVKTKDALRRLGGGCTMPSHSCPRLDAVRRRVGS